MMNLPIRFSFGHMLSFGLRRAAVWLVTGLVLAAGIAGCGGSSTDTGSTNSTNVSGGTPASTVRKRFDYPNVIDASFGNKGTVSVNTGYAEWSEQCRGDAGSLGFNVAPIGRG